MSSTEDRAIFATNLKRLMDEHGKSRNDLARETGIKYPTICEWLNRRKYPRIDKIQLLADYFGVGKAELIDRYNPDSQQLPDNIVPLKLKRIPVLGEIACGKPIWADQTQGSYVEVNDSADVSFALICKGDSMVGDSIYNGDYVLIREQPVVNNGEIACVLIEDEATLKHFYKDGDVVSLTASNPDYPPMVFSGPVIGNIRILGKAIGLTRFF